jgi:hypothetical protein
VEDTHNSDRSRFQAVENDVLPDRQAFRPGKEIGSSRSHFWIVDKTMKRIIKRLGVCFSAFLTPRFNRVLKYVQHVALSPRG